MDFRGLLSYALKKDLMLTEEYLELLLGIYRQGIKTWGRSSSKSTFFFLLIGKINPNLLHELELKLLVQRYIVEEKHNRDRNQKGNCHTNQIPVQLSLKI